ncbi:MAG: hypothetical protein ABSB10_10980, partial [Candidatus Bathyarchaeia archaeon]
HRGNSLIKDKTHIALSSQYEAVQETSKYIAELIAGGAEHGDHSRQWPPGSICLSKSIGMNFPWG